jgi:hypothetical protein
MYFVSLAGRNYNIAIRAGAAIAGRLAVFQSRLETCSGPLFPIGCDVDIEYYYKDAENTSGTRTITLLTGETSVSEQPTGVALTELYIVSLTGYGCTAYNDVYPCPQTLPTTTTTTTTSTTSTTTTVAPAAYSDPIVKHDQYSSSLGAITVSVWENVGTGGTNYKLFKSDYGFTNTGGSGTGVFLGLTGSLVEELYIDSALYSPLAFVSLYDKSFSYAAVFRVEAPTLGYTVASVRALNQANGIGISGGADSIGPYVKAYMYKPGSDLYGPLVRISTTPKWYLGVLTFDKTAGSSDAAKFYLNLSLTNFTGTSAIPTPSTFFSNDSYSYTLATTLNPIKLAAAAFWENTVLTQGQIQSIFNEYNSRYTLG